MDIVFVSGCGKKMQHTCTASPLACGTGRHDRVLRRILRTDLIIINDWGTARLTDEERRDLFEVVEDRCGRGFALIAARVPIAHWHESIGDPTLADVILDSLIPNAHIITGICEMSLFDHPNIGIP
mgnify:CR=1 FL=1